ncbi:hypothetical protein [Fischerella major]|uniref:hypothetical protein n=1 Tax=Fischerella major TaxID=210993 RepID=UPI000AE9763B|nr:hypothetical protein [Fischerella major]
MLLTSHTPHTPHTPPLREAATRLHTPPLREALRVLFEKPGFARLRGFAIVTGSGASAVDGSPGIKHLASKTATPSPLPRLHTPHHSPSLHLPTAPSPHTPTDC